MKAVIQRINKGSISVSDKKIASAKKGLAVFLGITHGDGKKEIDYMIRKITNLRVFSDDQNKMNLSLRDIEGDLLLISQFTLYGECKKGMRPSFTSAMEPKKAEKLYDAFLEELKNEYNKVSCGLFGADMKVDLSVDGPVTLIVETP